MGLRIIVDSGSDMLLDTAKEKNIEIVSLKVLFGDESFVDLVELSQDQFYQKMKESPHIPVTSLPSPQDFYDTYTKKGSEDEILVITISSKISGTHQSAMIAKEMLPDYKIEIIDSLNVSMAAGYLALRAYEMNQEGIGLSEIVEELNQLKKDIHSFILIDDLTNVIKGGRISNWKGSLAQVFKIKPTLYLTPEGEIHVKENARGRKKQIEKAYGFVSDIGKDYSGRKMYLMHSMAPEQEVIAVKERLLEKFGFAEVEVMRLGAIMGSHGGFGTIGLILL